MSSISMGSVFSRSPLTEANLVEIDRTLAERADRLIQTRKGRVWEYKRGEVTLAVRVEDIGQVLWDCEEELLTAGLLPEPGHYRVSFVAPNCGEDADREINALSLEVAGVVNGISIGARRRH